MSRSSHVDNCVSCLGYWDYSKVSLRRGFQTTERFIYECVLGFRAQGGLTDGSQSAIPPNTTANKLNQTNVLKTKMGGKKRDGKSQGVSQYLYGGTDMKITRHQARYQAWRERLEVRTFYTKSYVNYPIATFSIVFIWSIRMHWICGLERALP